MDYGKLSTTIDKKLKKSIDLVLNPEVDPETRRFNLEILLREVGDRVYEVIYAMNAYDMEIEYTSGVGQGDHYYGLAKNLSDSISLGGREDVEAQLDLWLQDVIHKAQYDAFSVAAESGKYQWSHALSAPIVAPGAVPMSELSSSRHRKCLLSTTIAKARSSLRAGNRIMGF